MKSIAEKIRERLNSLTKEETQTILRSVDHDMKRAYDSMGDTRMHVVGGACDLIHACYDEVSQLHGVILHYGRIKPPAVFRCNREDQTETTIDSNEPYKNSNYELLIQAA